MKSTMNYTAMRVKQFGFTPAVEVQCVDTRSKQTTDCLLLFKTIDEVIFLGADNFHPLVKAEMKEVAIEALSVGKGKLQIEAKQRVGELESSRLRQASIARQFRDAVAAWSQDISVLSRDLQNGLDTPTVKSRLMALVSSMERLKPNK
ncbi:hypothetical protein QM543_07260 [Pantoea eucrina]|uniref:hypothetical protein n=1 Tax=Pantoea eucrina TaxID=472693 RepID=UPI0024B775FE|nr:hypothetical protein [Pantoea eucrina]MDJ0023079.1 hypothetical protein [Pantoea eucrina]